MEGVEKAPFGDGDEAFIAGDDEDTRRRTRRGVEERAFRI